jgi:hypothetical protein
MQALGQAIRMACAIPAIRTWTCERRSCSILITQPAPDSCTRVLLELSRSDLHAHDVCNRLKSGTKVAAPQILICFPFSRAM